MSVHRNNCKMITLSLSISVSEETLKNALRTNQSLQRALHTEFLEVAESIHQNRAKVVFYTNVLFKKGSPKSAEDQLDIQGVNLERNGVAVNASRNGRWTRRFFVDHRGSVPKLNIDTLRRRKVEEESFFYHIRPPWSLKETAQLRVAVQTFLKSAGSDNTLSQSGENAPVDHRDHHPTLDVVHCSEKLIVDLIDYEAVATSLSPLLASIGDCVCQGQKRTAEECRVQYQNLKCEENSRNIFDSQEKLRVLLQIVSSSSSSVGLTNLDWGVIAEKTSMALIPQPEIHHLSGWNCFMEYYRKSRVPLMPLQTTSTVWTFQEDEFVLKYVAAAGPQTVVDSKSSLLQNTLLSLLCRKSKKQFFTRVNQSLLNPNMTKNDWSDYEERRLPICMKIYFSPNQKDCNQLYCASTHCHGRGSKSVVDKWNRSINPEYSTRPFTQEEDEALLQVMRLSLSQNHRNDPLHIGWTDLSHKFFPKRHPQRLQNRWSELATDQDIINREWLKLQVERSSNSVASGYGSKRQKRSRSKRNADVRK